MYENQNRIFDQWIHLFLFTEKLCMVSGKGFDLCSRELDTEKYITLSKYFLSLFTIKHKKEGGITYSPPSQKSERLGAKP